MFIQYNENPRDNFRAGDCVVRAISVVTGDCPYCYSVADFANEHPNGSYILATGSHAVACVSGDWIDSWDSGSVTPIYYYTKEGD